MLGTKLVKSFCSLHLEASNSSKDLTYRFLSGITIMQKCFYIVEKTQLTSTPPNKSNVYVFGKADS